MTTPHELDRMIDDQLDGNLPSQSQYGDDEIALTAGLIALANQFTLDANFDSALARQFKAPIVALPKSRRRMGWQRMVAAVATVLFALIFVTLSVPQFRAFAQDIIDDLFPRSEETERVMDGSPGSIDHSDFIGFATLEELREGVPFEVKLPTFENDEFVWIQNAALYMISRNAVFTSFSLPNRENPDLRIRQQVLSDATSSGVFWLSTEDNTVGATAEIIEVEFGEYTGEFVQGEWVTRDILTEGVKEFYWSNIFPVYRLRWQDDTFLYEIERISTDPIEPEDLVDIAESMMDD